MLYYSLEILVYLGLVSIITVLTSILFVICDIVVVRKYHKKSIVLQLLNLR